MKLEIRHLKLGVLGLALALIAGCERPVLPEGGFAAKAVLSKEAIHVGDVITLTMTARHTPGSTVKFPTLGNAESRPSPGGFFVPANMNKKSRSEKFRTASVYKLAMQFIRRRCTP